MKDFEKREELLDAASRAVNGVRQGTYGSPESSFRRIAMLWNAYLLARGSPFVELSGHDVALMMIQMKTARLMSDSGHADSWIDIIGYGACGGGIAVTDEDLAVACGTAVKKSKPTAKGKP